MKTLHIEFNNERLITPSGLVFIDQILGKSNFDMIGGSLRKDIQQANVDILCKMNRAFRHG